MAALRLLVLLSVLVASTIAAPVNQINVNWQAKLRQLNTRATLQMVVNPLGVKQSEPDPRHEEIYKGLERLNAEYVRFVPWLPYPKMGVAELEPPSGTALCGFADTDWPVTLTCKNPGSVIKEVQFASYGQPFGWCGGLHKSLLCHSSKSESVMKDACVGKTSCTVKASVDLFGDPCYGSVKQLAVQVVCSDPKEQHTYWDFETADLVTYDFLKATDKKADTRIINFSTPPEWLYQTLTRVKYPTDPMGETWDYEDGKELISGGAEKQGEYFGRLVSYYRNGRFVDEYNVTHVAPRAWNITWWEVMNEVESEHQHSVQQYTKEYDAIVQGIWKHADPHHEMKFVGMALCGHQEWDWYEYFLNAKNHVAGIPLDMISFHFYANTPLARDNTNGYLFFHQQADGFFDELQQVIALRNRLSPRTMLDVDETGVILPDDNDPKAIAFPEIYWNAAGSMYAYLYARSALVGLELLGESQLIGYPQLGDWPPQFPSVSMINWLTGEGNGRYWVLYLLLQHFTPDVDVMYDTQPTPQHTFCAQLLGEGNVTLACPNGAISSIDFASYGVPRGSCGAFTQQACHAPTSTAVMAKACVGKSSCTLYVDPAPFGGDPCVNVVKELYIQATCSDSASGVAPWSSQMYYAQAFLDAQGRNRRVLLINKNDDAISVVVPGLAGGSYYVVDESTGDKEPAHVQATSNTLELKRWAVVVAYLA